MKANKKSNNNHKENSRSYSNKKEKIRGESISKEKQESRKKAVCLISAGIDSAVAAWLMRKKGLELIFLYNYFSSSDKDISRVKKITRLVDKNAKLVINNFLATQQKLKEKAKESYHCLLCKRQMYKEAEKLAEKENAEFIVTGENLGQVASQTLVNLAVLDSAVKLKVLRPLLCFEKQEIINIAKKIGTYEISIKQAKKCRFLPKSPATKAKLELVQKEERKLF